MGHDVKHLGIVPGLYFGSAILAEGDCPSTQEHTRRNNGTLLARVGVHRLHLQGMEYRGRIHGQSFPVCVPRGIVSCVPRGVSVRVSTQRLE
jgi:hypothetical protein